MKEDRWLQGLRVLRNGSRAVKNNIEAVDANFGKKFWEYVKRAGYEHCNKSSGVPQFYRFSHPVSNQYPAMIELFTRKLDAIQLPEDAVLTPLPIDEDISSLSAILLDDDYYEFLKQGKVTVDGVTVLDAAYLIPFKAKAWMDLIDRKAAGEHVDSKNIKKHMLTVIFYKRAKRFAAYRVRVILRQYKILNEKN